MTAENRRTWLARIATLVITAAVTILAAAGVAHADASNTTGFGPCYEKAGICIPRGTMTITTRSAGGSGPDLNHVDAGFTYFGQICNLWIDHDFFDARGNKVRHMQGRDQLGCRSVAAQGWNFQRPFIAPKHGKHCATLFSQQPGYVKTWKRVCNNLG